MNKNIKYINIIFVMSLLLMLLLTGCVATVTSTAMVYGFWVGLWHGIISPITFFISLFNNNVAIYAITNIGHLYDFGFVIGTGGIGSLVRLLYVLLFRSY